MADVRRCDVGGAKRELLAVGSATVCLSSEISEVCAEGSTDDIEVRATGLMPGSEVVIESAQHGSTSFDVAGDGTLGAATGFLSVTSPDTVQLDISAVDADGERIAGQITLDD